MIKVVRTALIISLLFSPLAMAKSAYETLKFALQEQQITDDLRQKCQLPPNLSDDALRQTFLNDPQDKTPLIAAAQALKNNDNSAYRERMAQVVCPPQAG
ncbi:YicS family protein [Pantoea sp. USHLN298]|uniref:YicS family protein n=1 Tax=Pantoea sp. USHLN298 TaxID=3081294 RepID=UPI0030161088